MSIQGVSKNSFNHILRGMSLGGEMADIGFLEKTTRAGVNYPSAGFLQGYQLQLVTEIFLKAKAAYFDKNYNLSYQLTSCFSFALIFTPFVIGHILENITNEEIDLDQVSTFQKACKQISFLKQPLLLIHNNLAKVCQLATIVAMVALFHFGFTVYSTTGLIYAVITLIDSSGLLIDMCNYCNSPNTASKISVSLQYFSLINSCVSELLWGNLFFKILASIQILSFVFEGRMQKQIASYIDSLGINIDPVHISDMDKLDMSSILFQINKRHFQTLEDFAVHYADLFGDLRQCFANIDWKSRPVQEISHSVIHSNDRFKQDGQRGKEEEFLQKSFETFIDKIKFERVKDGPVYSYTRAKKVLSQILQMLQIKSDNQAFNNAKITALANLGVHGNFCGPGIFDVIQEERDFLRKYCPHEMNTYASVDQMTALEYFIQYNLAEMRKDRFDEAFQRFSMALDRNFLSKHFSVTLERHYRNQYAKLVNPVFGISLLSAENDRTVVPGVLDSILSCFCSNFLKITNYQPKDILEKIKELDKAGKITVASVDQWLEKRQQDYPQLPVIQKEDIYDSEGLLKNKFIKLMLIEMGVLVAPKELRLSNF